MFVRTAVINSINYARCAMPIIRSLARTVRVNPPGELYLPVTVPAKAKHFQALREAAAEDVVAARVHLAGIN